MRTRTFTTRVVFTEWKKYSIVRYAHSRRQFPKVKKIRNIDSDEPTTGQVKVTHVPAQVECARTMNKFLRIFQIAHFSFRNCRHTMCNRM
jgi:hypothetical protein